MREQLWVVTMFTNLYRQQQDLRLVGML